MKKLILLCSTAAIFAPATAYAQSTGSVDFENEAIVVTGTRTQEVGGVQAPDTSKPKAVLTQEAISRSNPGQTILDTINLVPGVTFQNNDAYGSSGGSLNIRGFDQSRISLTFDGIQLNDSGNYQIYSNQQLDPELIEQVNVNLGTTDVDSPTASAVGGTVNYRTRLPSKQFGARAVGSLGSFAFRRLFGEVDSGELGPWGTRAFLAASIAKNDNPFNNYGKVDKKQVNARVYQPLGADGDFVSLAGHYNQNRNNFFGSVRLRTDRNDTPNGFPTERDEREYFINYPCTTDVPQAGVADTTNTCGTEFDRRYNPSNTGNLRGASRFTLADNLVLTIDPAYQYVKANGGGTVTGREGTRTGFITGQTLPVTGFFGGQYYFGRDLNGDGDILDQVTLTAPSQTRTHRYTVISGLRYDISDDQTVRLSYTFDRANHRQTGEVGFLQTDGEPFDVFPINEPIEDSRGNVVQKRDRQSYAILHRFATEYRGEFGPLTVNAGIALPFFKRDLENYCFTTSASGFLDCFNGDSELEAAYRAAFPTRQGPQRRVRKYNKLLPNLGLLYDFTPNISAFASYAKGLSVPGTDALYDSFFFAPETPQAKPDPETTDTFDLGLRYRSSKVQAQAGVWYTRFNNRLASAYDPELDTTVYRNLGQVNKWGIDGSVAYSPIRQLTLYAFGSWNKSEIQDNLQVFGGDDFDCGSADPTSVTGRINCAFTKGKREAGSPKYSYGVSAVSELGAFQFGLTAKRTGGRFVYDTNEPIYAGNLVTGTPTIIYGAQTPAYWLVNADVRVKLDELVNSKTYLQFNAYNLFDTVYVGRLDGNLNQTITATGSSRGNFGSAPFAQIGAPRTLSATLSIGF